MTPMRMAMLTISGMAATCAMPATAAPHDRILRTAAIEGRVTGMTMGDYLWVMVRPTRGADFQAQPGAAPVDVFLDAHRDQPLTLQVQDVSRYIPEAGGRQETRVIAGARAGRTTAAAWWRSLSPSQRRAAQRHFERVALSSGGH